MELQETNILRQHYIIVTLSLNFSKLWGKKGSVSDAGDIQSSRLISYYRLSTSH